MLVPFSMYFQQIHFSLDAILIRLNQNTAFVPGIAALLYLVRINPFVQNTTFGSEPVLIPHLLNMD